MFKYLCNGCGDVLSKEDYRYVVTIQHLDPKKPLHIETYEYYLCDTCGNHFYGVMEGKVAE